MMCAAAKGELETACRCYGHFRAAILGSSAIHCTVYRIFSIQQMLAKLELGGMGANVSILHFRYVSTEKSTCKKM